MSAAEDFRHKLIAVTCIDGDVMERAGFCPDTIKRMMRDPLQTFRVMTDGERAKFWPLVEQYLEGKREQARVWESYRVYEP